MNTQPQLFDFNEHSVRIVEDEQGEPWFVANDVCNILELSNPRMAIKGLDDDEKSTVRITYGGPERNAINESGLYTLIVRSNKPEAKKFRKWVTSEVLPAIRKTGRYEAKPQVSFEDELTQMGIPLHAVEKVTVGERTYHLRNAASEAPQTVAAANDVVAQPEPEQHSIELGPVNQSVTDALLMAASDTRLLRRDHLVLSAMIRLCDGDNECRASREEICAESQVPVTEVSRTRTRLVNAGWLRKEGSGKYPRYFVTLPDKLSA